MLKNEENLEKVKQELRKYKRKEEEDINYTHALFNGDKGKEFRKIEKGVKELTAEQLQAENEHINDYNNYSGAFTDLSLIGRSLELYTDFMDLIPNNEKANDDFFRNLPFGEI